MAQCRLWLEERKRGVLWHLEVAQEAHRARNPFKERKRSVRRAALILVSQGKKRKIVRPAEPLLRRRRGGGVQPSGGERVVDGEEGVGVAGHAVADAGALAEQAAPPDELPEPQRLAQVPSVSKNVESFQEEEHEAGGTVAKMNQGCVARADARRVVTLESPGVGAPRMVPEPLQPAADVVANGSDFPAAVAMEER
eukprot:CAMPEP_0118866504 /NCGR_PEP_ID=MMETSP1163-20130328/10399_1 /TAXON_ID=124430 /ORGANISM="Phaeomonas parva, Strain CCMP2877" /LENGTH=195 /DNA_ID=CAMNT_0006800829 /DNA_START=204 /DNA_END=787 /DNA_ORIENTATION=-